MILSDRSLRQALDSGRIVISPFDDSLVQPSSIDVRLDRFFRVFRNHTAGVIDVKEDLSGLTELVEVDDDGVFMLHPGEFVLGATLERVTVPDDLVARIEGKSSLGRLGLLIHSSLPASEPLLVLDDEGLVMRTIGEIVKEQRPCSIVGFDPESLAVSVHEVTGWYEGPADRIYEVRLASGRSVRVTAGHTLFTLDAAGDVVRTRTFDLRPGTQVAIPRRIPAPPAPSDTIDVLAAIPETEYDRLVVLGPTIVRAHVERREEIAALMRDTGHTAGYFRAGGRLPLAVARQVPGLLASLGPDDRIAELGGRHRLAVRITLDEDLAWLLGMFVAKGHRRRGQVTISNTDQARLDRLQAVLARIDLPVSRSAGAVTCCSGLLSDLLGWIGTGGGASTKRVPPAAFGWSDPILESFLDGIVDGDGSRDDVRTSVWTTSRGLVDDLLVLFARLGRRASCTAKPTDHLTLWHVTAPHRNEPDDVRHLAHQAPVGRLDALADGDLAWDRVVSVTATDRVEPIYDIEVRPGGRTIENFLAGSGGVFVSNTAGFIDAGFDGHVTLELANVASLPITLYPGMKIGQISFMQMTTPADKPYGQGAHGSKYQGQRGPTPSRYWENFKRSGDDGQ